MKEEKSDPLAYAIFFQFLTGVFIGAFGFFVSDMSFPDMRPLIVNVILMVLLYAFGNVFMFKALKKIEASKFTIIFSSRALFTIFASSLLLGEFLSRKHWIGALFIFAGIVLVSFKPERVLFKRVEPVALLAAIFFGFATTNDRFLLKSFNVYPYLLLGFVAPALLIAVLNPHTIKKMRTLFDKKTLGKAILLSVFYGAAAITFYFALQVAPTSSQVVTINLTSVIIIVLLSIIFLKERENIPRKIVGAILSFLGLLLIS